MKNLAMAQMIMAGMIFIVMMDSFAVKAATL